MERKMAHIEIVHGVHPIENADAIECLKVLGWEVVAKKGDFKVGDKAVYLEIDSWCPHELAPFLSKSKEPREYGGVKGEKLRTAKMRGQISQGLVLPLSVLDGKIAPEECVVGLDVTSILGIQKWEQEVAVHLQGQIRSTFPTHYVSKTDEERCIASGTLITTNKGNVTIEEIVKDYKKYKILSYNEKKDVNEYRPIKGCVIQDNNNDWYKITTKQGKILYATSTHYIYNPVLKCYRQVSDFSIGDSVLVK
jgi:tRNA-binding EMAP/Myf-like protein